MRICFLGPADNAHMVKWCTWFRNRGHEVHVITFSSCKEKIEGVFLHELNVGIDPHGSDFKKLGYLFTARKIRRTIEETHPDIVNAHYAASYGVALALSGVKGYVLSIWGSDIYNFPKKSPFHRALLRYSLSKAGTLFSTSHAMAGEAAKYTKRKFEITPFGVDMELFNPDKRRRNSAEPFTIGTVKALDVVYGIDYLLRAVSLLVQAHPEISFSLRIAGSGPKEGEYRALALQLGLGEVTTFLGRISQEQAANEWADMDVAVIPSISYESFGVAAVEAQACGTPLVVTSVGGLMESTLPGKSSIVVPPRNAEAIADAIMKYHDDPALRARSGAMGREYVKKMYEIDHCFTHMEQLFEQICAAQKGRSGR